MAAMTVISVNRASPEHVVLDGRDFYTAITKLPTTGPVAVGEMGLDGDGVGSPKHHGGRDQAVYVYFADDYAWWSDELGRSIDPGTFGENLTISGMQSPDLAIGDRLHVGTDVTLEVSGPRIPCGTLAARMLDGTFTTRFREARRPGAYTRVLATGTVAAGDPVRLEPASDRSFALLDMFDLWYDRSAPAEKYRKALQHPVSERARATYERILAGSG